MRIFVGGLPRTATKDAMVRLFGQFRAGDDDNVLPRDRRTRRRNGAAYLEIADANLAAAAIAADRPLKRPRRIDALLFAFVAVGAVSGSSARADEASTDIGLTLNPIIGGVHQSFDSISHVPPVPIPLIELRERYGPFELDLSGLPPIASVRADNVTQGPTSTRLSLLDGIVRVWDPLRRYSAGIGQTLYNQSTHYLDPVEIAGTGETQFSRVTGITYQAGYGAPFRHGRFEAVFNYAPAMLGTQYTMYDVARFRSRSDPEKAEQIDTSVRYTRPVGRHADVIFGLRYVNYTARYAEPHGGLSDRNVGLLPVFGYRVRIRP